jgi:hypothetical protein
MWRGEAEILLKEVESETFLDPSVASYRHSSGGLLSKTACHFQPITTPNSIYSGYIEHSTGSENTICIPSFFFLFFASISPSPAPRTVCCWHVS